MKVPVEIRTWDDGKLLVGDWDEDGTFEIRVYQNNSLGFRSTWLSREAAERLLVVVADRIKDAGGPL